LGEKVISVFYTDPDVKDINDALSNALKARKYPETKYQGVGVGNCADTWIPNAAIRMKAREKEKQFKGSVVLLDTDHVLAKAWGLKETNDAGVVIIIGIDKKVKFIRSIKKADESKAVINEVLGIIDTEIAK
jgi:predicted transcriptional regulator